MNKQQCKSLVEIICNNNISELRWFIKNHPDALTTPVDEHSKYAIHYAAVTGLICMVNFICSQHPEAVHFKDKYEQTALIFATAAARLGTVKRLIALGSDINAKTSYPDNPLFNRSVLEWARHSKNQDCVTLILAGKTLKAQIESESVRNDETKTADWCYRTYKEAIEDENPALIDYLLHPESNNFNHLSLDNKLELLALTNNELPAIRVHQFLRKQAWPPVVCQEGFNLVQWSVVKGHLRLAEILLNYGENPKQTVSKPDSDDYGYSLIKLAFIYCQPDVVNLLIKKLWPDATTEEREDLLFYIKTGEQALDLAGASADFIEILSGNEEIRDLIEEELARTSSSEIPCKFYPKKRERPHSFHAAWEKGRLNIYKERGFIGQGTYGQVRLFKNQVGTVSLAVKSLKETSRYSIEREGSFFSRVYPDARSATGTFLTSYLQKGQSIQADRFVMPYFQTLEIDFSSLSAHEIARTFYMVAQELLRIHNLGIIHGDISVNNILFCRDHTVRFIDFGLAYETNSESAVVFSPRKDARITKRIAPERISDNKTLHPHASQDVYSLGCLFNEYIEQCGSESKAELTATFKSIEDFIENAMNIEPDKRPELALFCNQLKDELTQYVSQQASSNLTACMP